MIWSKFSTQLQKVLEVQVANYLKKSKILIEPIEDNNLKFLSTAIVKAKTNESFDETLGRIQSNYAKHSKNDEMGNKKDKHELR